MTLDFTFFSQAGNRIRLLDAASFAALDADYFANRLFTSTEINLGNGMTIPIYIVDLDGAKMKAERQAACHTIVTPIPKSVPVAPKEDGWKNCGSIPVYWYYYQEPYPTEDEYMLFEKDGDIQIRNAQGKVFYVARAEGKFGYTFYDHGERFFSL